MPRLGSAFPCRHCIFGTLSHLTRALALEDDLDEALGPSVRAAIMSPLLREEPDIALRVLTTVCLTSRIADYGRYC